MILRITPKNVGAWMRITGDLSSNRTHATHHVSPMTRSAM